MATSGSTNFSVNRNELISSGLRLIGVGIEGETLSNADTNTASEALNMILKHLMTFGLQLWLRDEHTLSLTQDKGTYVLGESGAEDETMTRPLRILDMVRRDTSGSENTDTEMTRLTEDEWYRLPQKGTSGTPVDFYYEPTIPDGTLKIWPQPNSTSASDHQLIFSYHTPIEDMDSGADDFDMPVEWMRPVKYLLAADIAPEYYVPLQEYQLIERKAQALLDQVLAWDQEDSSIYLQPDWRSRFGRR